ncbi:auxilin-like protein 1 isoform X2 [Fagus crenata]
MGFRFVTTATLSPRAEDYSEIFESFHASHASSIPVLDLPTINEAEAEVFSDVQSSSFDYSEVFGGGFDGLDCAASFEDLLYDGSNGRNVHSSSEEEEEACVVAGFYCAFRFVG